MKPTRHSRKRCYDARGRAVTPADTHLLPQGASAAVRKEIANSRLLSLRSLAIIAGIVAAIVLVRLGLRLWLRPSLSWLYVGEVGAATASLAVAYLFVAFHSRRRFEDRAVRAWLSIGHCAACGYSLRAIPPDFDGATVCPECGAAWRLGNNSSRSASSMGDVP